jgi:uncharacterized protein
VESLLSNDRYLRGIRLYNAQQFYECHEVLEDLWRPLKGPQRLFLQGLIHLAVGFYHHQQNNPAGAERQLHKGLRKLAGYLPHLEGVDTAALYREAQACLERIRAREKLEGFPEIRGDCARLL